MNKFPPNIATVLRFRGRFPQTCSDSLFRISSPSKYSLPAEFVLKDSGSWTLPGIPRPEDLSCDLVWIRARDRFELLQPAGEAICKGQIPELIRCDPV